MLLSPFLCELYLHNHLDKFWQNKGIAWVRFEDEFVVLASQEAQAQYALELAETRLRKLGLALNPDKTQVIRSSSKHKFLGKRLPNSQSGSGRADHLKRVQLYQAFLKKAALVKPSLLSRFSHGEGSGVHTAFSQRPV
jgi:hypothetical protein